MFSFREVMNGATFETLSLAVPHRVVVLLEHGFRLQVKQSQPLPPPQARMLHM